MIARPKPRTAPVSWRRLLKQAESLRGQSGVFAYQRAKIVTRLFEDDQFRSEKSLSDDDAVDEVLDDLVQDLCLTAAELREMLRAFPDSAAWESGKLREMKEQTEERLAVFVESRKRTDAPKKPRRVITQREYDALAGEKQDLEARLRFLENEVQMLRAENERLKAENEALKIENAELRGRLAALENR